jgi:hypothetical protein
MSQAIRIDDDLEYGETDQLTTENGHSNNIPHPESAPTFLTDF